MTRKVDKEVKKICEAIRNGEIVPIEDRFKFILELVPDKEEREYLWRWLEHTL